MATKNPSSPYQNESLRFPTITAATIASTKVMGLRKTAAVHRMRSTVRRGRDDTDGDVQRRGLRDRGDAARIGDLDQDSGTADALAAVSRLRDELRNHRD